MEIDNFKIITQYKRISLEGTCWVILPYTYSIVMDKPYKGLSITAYIREGFTVENIKSRVVWELGRLYEQFQDIFYDYDRYRKMWEEWKPYEQKIQKLKDEADTFRQGTDSDKLALLDFHNEMLKRDMDKHFHKLLNKYEIMPLSLSPSVLETSIRLIEKEFCNRQ